MERKTTTDWSLCCLCQAITDDALIHPFNNPVLSRVKTSYQLLETNISDFESEQISPLPLNLNPSRLNEGTGIAETLIVHKAVWHKTCRTAFSRARLERAQKRKAEQTATDDHISQIKTRLSTPAPDKKVAAPCFFCDKEIDTTTEDYRKASTLGIDKTVYQCAKDLSRGKLLAKLSSGDMHAMDALYHIKCLNKLYNDHRAYERQKTRKNSEFANESIAFAELIAYLEDTKYSSEENPVFKLSYLSSLYNERLDELNDDGSESHVHTTRLKERIEHQLPKIQSYSKGREVYLMYEEDVANVIHNASKSEYDSTYTQLAQVARVVRDEILQIKTSFSGSWEKECQKESVSKLLQTLVSMILHGTDITRKHEANENSSQPVLSLSQLITFNCKSRRSDGASTYHSIDREPPLPLYMGLLLHSRFREKDLIGKFHQLGLSVSYTRVKDVTDEVANTVCDAFATNDVVCPLQMRKNVFTTGAVDNFNHKPTSKLAKDVFNGTALTLAQHLHEENEGNDGPKLVLTGQKDARTPKLPESYTEIPPSMNTKSDVQIPLLKESPQRTLTVEIDKKEEYEWLHEVERMIAEDLSKSDYISWAAFHASRQTVSSDPTDIIGLLPLFPEKTCTVAMMKHSMDLNRKSISFLNPGQTPVQTADEPLFAIAKQIQWTWPHDYGEDKYVLVMGGLHIEMAMLGVLGNFMVGSGWTAALVEAEIFTSGRADGILKGTPITRARYAHQVTSASLHLLLTDAYSSYKESEQVQEKSFDEWCEWKSEECPQFLFWYTAFQLELLYLQYIRSLRTADFALYLATLQEFAPWFFVFDHVNYSRWLPVHIKDMIELEEKHPDVYRQFTQGDFVVRKTQHVFSAIALDHAHEQSNDDLKDDGGVVGLTENPEALSKQVAAAPEIIRMLHEFESDVKTNKVSENTRHHDQIPSVQIKFQKHVQLLQDTIKEWGNPFMEESEDLVAIDTKDVADPQAITILKSLKDAGNQQYDDYVDQVLVKGSRSISDPISKNNFAIFKHKSERELSKEKLQSISRKNDVALFSRLYVACQTRDGNLPEFFQHENQPYPPSLSSYGYLREGTKSDLTKCLEDILPNDSTIESDNIECKIIDGSFLVHMVQPRDVNTFDEYASQIISYLAKQFENSNVQRLDIVFDVYKNNSLKQLTRDNRGNGKGQRRKVKGQVKVPITNWHAFLRNDSNKTELFHFLADQIVKGTYPDGKEVYVTKETEVLSCPPDLDKSNICPCNHEESDTRLFLHAKDAADKGFTSITVRASDTDVVIIGLATLGQISASELWIEYGTGKHYRLIPIHSIAEELGEEKCITIPMFHALTGCDTTSFFSGRGKKTAWDVWKMFQPLTYALYTVSNKPHSIPDDTFAEIQRFVVLMYNRSSGHRKVNDARIDLFCKNSRSIENIPPTEDALFQHTLRAVLQAGYCWAQALVPQQDIPDPSKWGWNNVNGKWQPLWITKEEASKTCYELLHCGCRKGCQKQCKCKRANLQCTALCRCSGNCQH